MTADKDNTAPGLEAFFAAARQDARDNPPGADLMARLIAGAEAELPGPPLRRAALPETGAIARLFAALGQVFGGAPGLAGAAGAMSMAFVIGFSGPDAVQDAIELAGLSLPSADFELAATGADLFWSEP